MNIHSRTMVGVLAWIGALLLIATASTDAQEESDRADEITQIRQRVQSFVQTLGKGDAKRVASFWTSGGEYAGGDGISISGRSNVEEAYRDLFSEAKDIEAELNIDSIRFLSDNTAIAQGTFAARRVGEEEGRSSGFSILLIREGGQWYFGVLREYDKTPALRDLHWLIGDWSYKNAEAEVKTSYSMCEQAKCILMRFDVKRGGESMSGLQVIALDPATDSIRSWRFSGDGGLGQAVWEADGKRWVITSTNVTPTGEEVMATTIITPINADSFTWQAVRFADDGQEETEVGPITVERVAK